LQTQGYAKLNKESKMSGNHNRSHVTTPRSVSKTGISVRPVTQFALSDFIVDKRK